MVVNVSRRMLNDVARYLRSHRFHAPMKIYSRNKVCIIIKDNHNLTVIDPITNAKRTIIINNLHTVATFINEFAVFYNRKIDLVKVGNSQLYKDNNLQLSNQVNRRDTVLRPHGPRDPGNDNKENQFGKRKKKLKGDLKKLKKV